MHTAVFHTLPGIRIHHWSMPAQEKIETLLGIHDVRWILHSTKTHIWYLLIRKKRLKLTRYELLTDFQLSAVKLEFFFAHFKHLSIIARVNFGFLLGLQLFNQNSRARFLRVLEDILIFSSSNWFLFCFIRSLLLISSFFNHSIWSWSYNLLPTP